MKRRIEIVFLGRHNPGEILTGPEKVAKRIFDKCSNHYDCVFIEYFFEGNKFGYQKKIAGKELMIDQKGLRVFRFGILQLIFYLFYRRPEIIHIINYERFAAAAFLYKIFCKVFIIYNVHGIIYHENTSYKKVSKKYILKDKICEKIFLKYSDKLLFLSQHSLDLALKYFKFDKKKTEIIPNGIDGVFNLHEKEMTERSNLLKIVFVADINRIEKGFQFILKCLDQVSFSYDFYIIGKSTKSDVIKYSLKNYHFLESTDTIEFSNFLKDKDIYLSGSSYEPFSISAAECMAAGVVPIVTRQTGMSRYISHLSNGFVFELNDEKGFVNALEMLNSNRDLLLEISKKARLLYCELNWEKVFEKYANIYESFR